MKPPARIAVLWPDAENYARFCEVCDDTIKHATVEAYHRSADVKLEELSRSGVTIKRVAFDPDELAAWARAEHCRIDSQARAAFAGILAARASSQKLN